MSSMESINQDSLREGLAMGVELDIEVEKECKANKEVYLTKWR